MRSGLSVIGIAGLTGIALLGVCGCGRGQVSSSPTSPPAVDAAPAEPPTRTFDFEDDVVTDDVPRPDWRVVERHPAPAFVARALRSFEAGDWSGAKTALAGVDPEAHGA